MNAGLHSQTIAALFRHSLFYRNGLALFFLELHLSVFKCFGCTNHAVARVSSIVPALDFHPFALKILVNREKMGDFFQHMGINVGVVPDVRIARIVFPDGEHFFIQSALIEHFE